MKRRISLFWGVEKRSASFARVTYVSPIAFAITLPSSRLYQLSTPLSVGMTVCGGEQLCSDMLARADTDKDGLVSLEQFDALYGQFVKAYGQPDKLGHAASVPHGVADAAWEHKGLVRLPPYVPLLMIHVCER